MRILGLDLGTNSVGWAVIEGERSIDENDKEIHLQRIEGAGSRIIPMGADNIKDFENGNSVSQTKERTGFRGMRRLLERRLLRRERLHRVLNLMGFLPPHYAENIDRYGKFKIGTEPKLPWTQDAAGQWTFLFMDSYNEMLSDFAKSKPQLLTDGHKIPYDWTVYYLRKKALSAPLTKEELAWLLLNFNQKRGYHQLRGEDDIDEDKQEDYVKAVVVSIDDEGISKGKHWYALHLDNDMVYRRPSDVSLDVMIGKPIELVVTTKKNKDGDSYSFRAPKEDDWSLMKIRTEQEIKKSEKTVGEYIYDSLLNFPDQKIIGSLVRTVDRSLYKKELEKILKKQSEYIEELNNPEIYKDCVNELYQQNEAHRANLACRDLPYFLVNDILFYQRPLKSKKSLIEDCPFEKYNLRGAEENRSVKCIAKSHPLFQEFRLWQFLQNLHIIEKEHPVLQDSVQCDLFGNKEKEKKSVQYDYDATCCFLNDDAAIVKLFDFLNDKKEITQDDILKYFKIYVKNSKGQKGTPEQKYRWNYVEDKTYPCNETRALMFSYLEKAGVSHEQARGYLAEIAKRKNSPEKATDSIELALWHILYSVSDKEELKKALTRFFELNPMPGISTESLANWFVKAKPFDKNYGSYSAKAIAKLLPLMRAGKYWKKESIDTHTLERINKIIAGECDESIKNRVRDKLFGKIESVDNCHYLPLWLACYIVYDRHSESGDVQKWENPADLERFLNSFRQHSLRNPIVEQVVLETLRVVHDIWCHFGNIDEIHLEMGRDLKLPNDKRQLYTQQILNREYSNMRIKALLAEFIDPRFGIEGVRPYSPMQQDILHLYEDEALANAGDMPADIVAIQKNLNSLDKKPSLSDVIRYKEWIDQKCCSPYTGKPIPLSKLFTPAYQIEHVIPKAVYFDDSLSNKVICEAEVNQLKTNMLGHQFIAKHQGEIVPLGMGKSVKILALDEYEAHVKKTFASNQGKMKRLLMDEIPDDFISRQLNDSRYISKYVKSLLSNVVRAKLDDGTYEQEDISKNLIPTNGSITDREKKDWGIKDIWNEIILPRFKRMEEIDPEHHYVSTNQSGQVIPIMPEGINLNKKRIDHRHHAMDAIVIACASRDIVKYLNNESARKNAAISRTELQRIICDKDSSEGNGNYSWVLKKPWPTFTQDVRTALQNIIVSFKQNQRVINRTSNHYLHYENGKKVKAVQAGQNWAIRKSMHKDTVFGLVNLKLKKQVQFNVALKTPKMIVDNDLKVKIQELLTLGYDAKRMKKYFDENKEVWSDVTSKKVEVYYFSEEAGEHYYATRFISDLGSYLGSESSKGKIESKISKITDTGIQKILYAHLNKYLEHPADAFTAEGIADLNEHIKELNGGKDHKPIYKVRRCEQANKYAVGQTGNKSKKYVEADKGTNLYFAIYVDADGKRYYSSIPLNVVVDREKKGLSPVPETDEAGHRFLFSLSPTDLVYLPTADELKSGVYALPLDKSRIYKMVSTSIDKKCYFISCSVASMIRDGLEFESGNKSQMSLDGNKIKETCVPIKVSRIGEVVMLNGEKI